VIGTSLAHFEITSKLGEGGMGTVYRGRDTKLGREVAIKVLPEAFTSDAERLARFEREAKLLASLNHPSIAGIYEVGEDGPVHFLVMELAEGEDLQERLKQGPMSVEEALPIARRIAEALEAAHKSGVIHRDLKPANVKLTPDGRVKVLDFGLAKAFDSGMGGAKQADMSHSPTLTAQMTSAGMILGTAAYMSPEQAKGEEADKRSDIWSFGIVLWEMLVGRKTFAEDTVSETLAAVLKSDPDHSALPPTVPLGIRRLIERCLQKDPGQRLHDIADVRLEIEAVIRGDDSAGMMAPDATADAGSSKPWKVITAASVVVALLALATHLLPSRAPEPDASVAPVRFAIDRPPLYMDFAGPGIAISPDGTRVAYQALNEAGNSQIYLRGLGAVEATPIPGTEYGMAPFFSPDGSRIGFSNLFQILTVALHGGAPREIVETQNFRGAAWADDDSIWFGPDTETGLWRLRSGESQAERVTVPDAEKGERSHRWPAVLPGSDVVLFTVGTADINAFDEAQIDALRVSTGERKTVIDSGMFPMFLEPDILLYTFSGSLMAVRFEPATLSTIGEPTPVVDRVRSDPLSGIVAAAVSPDGSLAVGHGPPIVTQRRLVAYDREGKAEMLSADLLPYQGFALSPDGTTLALDIDAANAAIWLLDLERDVQTRLTTRWSHTSPTWSPDGSELISASSSGGTYSLHRHHLVKGSSEALLESSDEQLFATSWSSDGRIAATVIPKGQGFDVWVLPVEEPSRPIPILDGPYMEFGGRFSPDGRWLAFSSNESGQMEAYIVPSDKSGSKIRVSSDGGVNPVWDPDGDQILFYNNRAIYAATIGPGDRPRVGRPEFLFEVGELFFNVKTLGVMPDGRPILLEQIEEQDPVGSDLIFTRHWIGELERLLAPN
jgi:serine/threonine-protein kinase